MSKSEHESDDRVSKLEAELAEIKTHLSRIVRVLGRYEFAEPQFNSTDMSVLERLRKLEDEQNGDQS